MVQSVRKSNTHMLLHTPIGEPFVKYCYERDLLDCSNPTFQTSHSPFRCHSYPVLIHCEEQTQNALPIVLHTILDHVFEGMQTLIPQLLAWYDMTRRQTLIPSQTNLHFLVQHWNTSKASPWLPFGNAYGSTPHPSPQSTTQKYNGPLFVLSNSQVDQHPHPFLGTQLTFYMIGALKNKMTYRLGLRIFIQN